MKHTCPIGVGHVWDCDKPQCSAGDIAICDSHKKELLNVKHAGILDELPRPWKADSLMIRDAKGTTVSHFGGQDPRRSGEEISRIVKFIVQRVNDGEPK